jgi:Carboxypeptidase regulatory-like domain
VKTSRKFALVVLVAMAAAVLYARGIPKDKASQLRTVRGTVVDKDENPVDGAVVYLKNQRTQDIVTHLSDGEGKFRFSGLDLNVDYEIHAVHGDMMSSSRSISNFDTRKDFVVTLKLDHKKTDK